MRTNVLDDTMVLCKYLIDNEISRADHAFCFAELMKPTHAPDLSVSSEFQKSGTADFTVPAFWKNAEAIVPLRDTIRPACAGVPRARASGTNGVQTTMRDSLEFLLARTDNCLFHGSGLTPLARMRSGSRRINGHWFHELRRALRDLGLSRSDWPHDCRAATGGRGLPDEEIELNHSERLACANRNPLAAFLRACSRRKNPGMPAHSLRGRNACSDSPVTDRLAANC